MRGKLPPLLAVTVGVVSGVYIFQPLLAHEAREKQKRRAIVELSLNPNLNLEKEKEKEKVIGGQQGGVGKPAKAVVVEVTQPTEAEAEADGDLDGCNQTN